MAETSRAAGARQLIGLLELLIDKPVPPAELMDGLNLPRTTLFRLRRQAIEWGVQILASPAGWEVTDWGVFSKPALRRKAGS